MSIKVEDGLQLGKVLKTKRTWRVIEVISHVSLILQGNPHQVLFSSLPTLPVLEISGGSGYCQLRQADFAFVKSHSGFSRIFIPPPTSAQHSRQNYPQGNWVQCLKITWVITLNIMRTSLPIILSSFYWELWPRNFDIVSVKNLTAGVVLSTAQLKYAGEEERNEFNGERIARKIQRNMSSNQRSRA